MRKSGFIITLFVVLSASLLRGQDNKYEYGKITQDEFDMKSYPKDKEAEAVVLFDIGKSYFVQTETGYKVVFEKHTRIKVLSDAGIKYGEIDIPFYQQGSIYEEIQGLEGVTYNPDEQTYVKKSMLNTRNSYDEKLNENWKIKKFAMPDVKAGSIIEYRYKIYSDYVFNLREWEFQSEIPVVFSKYTVKMIPFYEYTFILQGTNKFDIQKSYEDYSENNFAGIKYKDYIHEYGMKDIQAFKDEKFISSKEDYIMKISFQLSKINEPRGGTRNIISTWEELNKEMLGDKDFGKYLLKAEKSGTKNAEIQQLKSLSEEEKFNGVLEYVKNNFNWNEKYGKFASKNISELEKSKIGNSADVNLYTIGLLRSVGINVSPVIISTRRNGKIKSDYPFLSFFNDVILLADVNGKKLLSDATNVMNLNNRIPLNCVNDIGLIVKEGKVEWVNTTVPIVSDNTTNIKFTIDKNNAIRANIVKIATEYSALDYKENCGEDKEKVKKRFNSQTYEIQDSTIQFANYKKRNKTYAVAFDIINKPEIINNKMYINPFFDFSITENPLKQPTRTYPIDMIYPERSILTSTFNIPEGWMVDYIPSPQKTSNDLFDLQYYTIKEDNEIKVTFTYYFKKSIYPSFNYIDIKSFFNDIVSKGNDKIVLIKQ